MRSFLFATLAVVSFASCNKTKEPETIANNKAVTWAKSLGGTQYDFAKSMVQLPNGEYVMAGTTRSTDGDVGGSRFGYDAWLVKLDTAGNKIWSNTYGGGADEHTTNLIATSDGGFLLSGFNGFLFDTTLNDAWVIKTNAAGNMLWRKDFSVSGDSKAVDLLNANDGGYVIVGYNTSQANGRDGWIFKLDANGNNVWSKLIGGTKEDQLTSIVKASNGGYVVAGYSNSNEISGAKGNFDGWFTKIDDGGTTVWTKLYGGSNKDFIRCLVAANDGGYMAVGSTNSASGDFNLNRGSFDELAIKIDRDGNKLWSKTYGGTNDEFVTSVAATNDGGFISVGYTNSTNFDVTRFSGDFGGWLIKMDANGNKTGSSTYGENYDDLVDEIIKTNDGGFIIAGQTFNPTNLYNAWVVKITDF